MPTVLLFLLAWLPLQEYLILRPLLPRYLKVELVSIQSSSTIGYIIDLPFSRAIISWLTASIGTIRFLVLKGNWQIEGRSTPPEAFNIHDFEEAPMHYPWKYIGSRVKLPPNLFYPLFNDLLSINQSIQGARTWLIGYFEPFGLNWLIDGLESLDWLKLALMIAVLIYVKLRPSSPVSPVE